MTTHKIVFDANAMCIGSNYSWYFVQISLYLLKSFLNFLHTGVFITLLNYYNLLMLRIALFDLTISEMKCLLTKASLTRLKN